eukprot:m51a1_g10198 putative alcohol dehydrogenase (347) ;mRNA; r:41498-42764
MACCTGKTMGYMATAKGEDLKLQEFALRPLGPQDVEVDIAYTSLCHADAHMKDNEWGITAYPIVPGHEGVGKVSAVGSEVKGLKVGQMVGIGWIRDSCGSCPNCQRGAENICHKGYTGTIITAQGAQNTGTFAKKIRIAEKFAFPIPAGLDAERAAPLLCAGIAVYEPLRRYIAFPGARVGVVGLGGLGHLAVKFARAMGAEVTALSSTEGKRAEATAKLGAHHFACTSDAAAMAALANSFDLILDASSASANWEQLIGMLRAGGVLCLVGTPVEKIPVPTTSIVFAQKSVAGSIVAGTHAMNQMLNFCAVNQIYPECEPCSFADINAALKRVVANKAHYRIVLKW